MERREFVKLLLAAAAARVANAQNAGKISLAAAPAPAPVPWTLGIEQLETVDLPATDPGAVAQFRGTFFTARQMSTLRKLCQVLLPALDGKPGAVEAGTPEFLDFFIGESDAASKELYCNGLNWLDAQSAKVCRVPFALANGTQADALLRPWLRPWMEYHLPTEPQAHFVNAVHDDIRLATIHSPAWDQALRLEDAAAAQELYWLPIEPDVYHFRVASDGGKLNRGPVGLQSTRRRD